MGTMICWSLFDSQNLIRRISATDETVMRSLICFCHGGNKMCLPKFYELKIDL